MQASIKHEVSIQSGANSAPRLHHFRVKQGEEGSWSHTRKVSKRAGPREKLIVSSRRLRKRSKTEIWNEQESDGERDYTFA